MLDGNRVTRRLFKGNVYGHSVELIHNYALWPYELLLHSTPQNREQLCYLEGTNERPDWSYVAVLQPGTGDGERIGILKCIKKISSKDVVTTRIMSDAGHCDSLAMEIEIE